MMEIEVGVFASHAVSSRCELPWRPVRNLSVKAFVLRGESRKYQKTKDIEMAGAAGLEPVTSAVTGQRSNQLSYAPAHGAAERKKSLGPRQGRHKEMFGQQTPRRWGWGTPLKKRAATRTS